MLEPVRGVGESVEFGAIAITDAFVGHVGKEESVALAPEDARGDVNARVRKSGAMTKSGAVPVNHGGEGAGLRPSGAILLEVIGRECALPAGAD